LYHYKLSFDLYAYMFDICTNKIYLLTYLRRDDDESGDEEEDKLAQYELR